MNREAKRYCVIGLGKAGIEAINLAGEKYNNFPFGAENVDFWGISTAEEELHGDYLTDTLLISSDEINNSNRFAHEIQKGAISVIENKGRIVGWLSSYSKICIVCGLGGGTASGALCYIVKWALESGVDISIRASYPFRFEGSKVYVNAQMALESINCIEINKKIYNLNDMFEFIDKDKSIYDILDEVKSCLAEDVIKWITKPDFSEELMLDEDSDAMTDSLKADLDIIRSQM